MTTLKDAKLMGGIGSILALLSAVPHVGFILGIAGLVLIAVAINYISKVVNNPSIFNDFLISLILSIVSIVIAAAAGITAFITTFHMRRPFLSIITGVLIFLIIMWVLMIISAIFLRRSYIGIAKALNVGMFSTVGLLYLIGSITLIILVGFIILLIAGILQIVAFFEIPEELPKQPPTQLQSLV